MILHDRRFGSMLMVLLLLPGVVVGQERAPTPRTITLDQKIAAIIQQEIDDKQIPGAVVLVMQKGSIILHQAYGHRLLGEKVEPLTTASIFDLASLTKPVATASAIMILVDEGKCRLEDPVASYWPEFAQNGKEKVTLSHCLLHTSGLTPDNSIRDYSLGRKQALENIAQLKLSYPLGTQFKYSDVGYIVLGQVIEKISGLSLDQFTHQKIFKPLGMSHTSFRPVATGEAKIVPTGTRQGKTIMGEVHDPRAFALGGVAGHAGLFSSAADLARFCTCLLPDAPKKLFSEKSLKLLTEGTSVPGDFQRSHGWDVSSPYSGQKGSKFRAESGFGHTGFTGTSIWVDRPSQTLIVILASRLYPQRNGDTRRLRRQIADEVADFLVPKR